MIELKKTRCNRWLLGALVAASLTTMGCEPAGDTQTSLLFITVDTTRADRLGAYGYEPARTPVMDRLAAEGTLFERAYAPAPETLPSHSSMFTGHYPPSHAVRLNLNFQLPAQAQTLAETLRDGGYHTVAVTSASVLDRSYGLHQGFLTYDDTRRDGVAERRGDRVTELALEALDQLDDRPYFLWAHYYDAHSPFDPPAAHRSDQDLPPDDPQLYDGEIAFVDEEIGKLLDGLEARGQLDDTLIVIVGDHGESLGEHGEAYHTLFVYDATIRVPLILRGPGVSEGSRIEEPVSTIDLFTTTLRLLGFEPPAATSRSLPGVFSPEDETERIAYAESMAPPFRFGWQALQSVRTADWLYVRAPEEELYRLDGSDPRQEVNLAFEERSQLAEMRERLDAALASMPAIADEEAAGFEPSESELDALEALGYLSAGDSVDADHEGKDPKDMVEVAEAYQLARLAARLGRLEQAEGLLAWTVTIDPDNSGCRRLLGRIRYSLGKYDEAALDLAMALEPGNDRWDLLVDLAAAEERAGVETASARIERAIDLADRETEVWRRLGRLRVHAGEIDGAREAFAKVVELEPEDRDAVETLERLQGSTKP